MKLGEWIRQQRYRLNITQNELAARMNVSNVTVSNLENDKHCGRQSIYKLSELFGEDVTKLGEMRDESYKRKESA